MTAARYATILVEGYHDRAFLSGWLVARGWSDPGVKGRRRVAVTNPVTGKVVTGGRFAFESPTRSTFVELVPSHGDRTLLDGLGPLVERSTPGDPHEVVVVLDADGENLVEGVLRREAGVEDRLRRVDPGVTRSDGFWRCESGLEVSLVVWGCEAGPGPGVPRQQCLERVIAAALAEVYPDRAQAVEAWLGAAEVMPQPPIAKAFTWSHMAGWFADEGCEAFLRGVWGDPAIFDALSRLLDASQAARVVARLERATPSDV
jgi:hypothetical protein